ncbi:InlB B-repeat-containing protein [Peptoniphilus phoceensis]|uniref:InlB B-repeat-containing protein n=1 Tax=Peptoniphilus phoceensis TaxID=1720298 RepID=UPI000782B5A4|nr:InlB B-repeat-containing protein [Peptoniphilus phoceensis]
MKNKKILSLLLAGVMVTSIPFNVFADEGTTEDSKEQVVSGETLDKEEKTPLRAPEAEEFTVTFNSNEGSKVEDAKTVDGIVTKPADPTKDGYTFDGWYTDEGLTKVFDFNTKLTSDTILYAKWKAKTPETKVYTVIFEASGGDFDGKVEKDNDGKIKEPTAPTKKGYKFLGWYDGSTKVTFPYEVTKDVTLKAKWEKVETPAVEKFTVTFNSKGGSSVATQTIEKGKTATKPTDPTKKGYTFVAWYTDDGKFVNRFNFSNPVTEDTILYAKWEEEKPVVPAKEDLYISDIEYDGDYVTGKVTSKGVAVDGATVTLKIDGYKTSYKDKTDSYGRFKVYLGKYYDDYRYYYDDYYYRDGYTYYDGYRVYSDSDGWYYYKNGRKHYINYSSRYYRRGRDYSADLIAEKDGYYSAEKNLWKDGYYNNGRYYGRDWYDNKYDHKVYPSDVYRTNYSTSGYLKGYKNRTVYVYDDGTYLGSDTIDSDGYFKVTWNSPYISTSRTLDYYVNGKYVNDSGYSIIPTVNTVSAGAKYLKGNAGNNASVTVYDSNGVKLGSTTAGSTGIYNINLNRALRAGETIKVEAKESGKIARSTEYKVGGVSTNVEAKVNQPSYIAGYPDGTFGPSREVTRAEAVRMFVKLVNNGAELPKNPTTKFKDANNKWYSDEINYAVSKGFIKGYSDGTFKPNQTITRAEFAQMISVFVKDGYPGSSNFKDVKGHWASDAINELYGNKNIKGYSDGTFKPDQKLTRAEAVTILNSVFGRNTKSTSFANVSESGLKKFKDVSKSHWAYYEILDASNGHNAVKGDKSDDVSVWQ